MFLGRTSLMRKWKATPATALEGRRVAVVPTAYVHRWTALRGQARQDLLPRIPANAKRVLDFGCAEGLLGQDLKKRQPCRVVGIEIDAAAAAAARTRLDEVHTGDATHLVTLLDERFDCIIGGDVLEHIEDPWSFLMDLRRLAQENASLILSIPNVANWAILSDLLQNRFDYAYIAITCAGHLRFFTRTSIGDTLEMTGWRAESIEPQPFLTNRQSAALLSRLEAAGLASPDHDLLTPGYYVTARKA